jgi:hypothetical protein
MNQLSLDLQPVQEYRETPELAHQAYIDASRKMHGDFCHS